MQQAATSQLAQHEKRQQVFRLHAMLDAAAFVELVGIIDGVIEKLKEETYPRAFTFAIEAIIMSSETALYRQRHP